MSTSGLIASCIKPMTSKIGIHSSKLRSESVVVIRQVYLCSWEKHLVGFPLGVVNRWPPTPRQAGYSAWIAFSSQDKYYMLLNTKFPTVSIITKTYIE